MLLKIFSKYQVRSIIWRLKIFGEVYIDNIQAFIQMVQKQTYTMVEESDCTEILQELLQKLQP